MLIKEKKLLNSNIFFVFIASMIEMVSSLILIALLTRSFEPKVVGTYFLAIAAGGICQAVVNFGLYPVAVRELSTSTSEKTSVLITFLYVQLIMICVLLLPFLGVIQFLSSYDPYLSRCVLFSVFFQAAVVPFAIIGSAVFQAAGKIYWEAIATFLSQGVIILGVAAGLYFYKIDLIIVFKIICVGSVVKLMFSFFIIHIKLIKLKLFQSSWCLMKGYFLQCWPIALHDLVRQGHTRIGIIMLEVFSTREQVALFAAPFRLLIKTRIIAISFVRPILPVFSRMFMENDMEKLFRFYKKSFFLLFLVGTILACILSFGSKFFVVLFLGPEFKDAWVCFFIFSWFVPITFVYFLTINLLYAGGAGKQVLTASAVSFVFNCVSAYFLVLKYQAKGGALAFLMSVILLFVMVLIPVKNIAANRSLKDDGKKSDEKQA
ncbi:MAG: oligosaccharide flippase family protein [Thermodesulfobacteriota bacterium]|nr:oligosaccharide flippase family protein [Thermodesulfobacteriota bacterium]